MNVLVLDPKTVCVEKSEVYQAEQLDKLGMEVIPVDLETPTLLVEAYIVAQQMFIEMGIFKIIFNSINLDMTIFASDNVTSACPEIMNAIIEANSGNVTLMEKICGLIN